MRQIVVDTETTGLEFSQGHRVVEIGCVELLNRRVTGETFHRYINPQRDIDEAALEIHGITAEKLKDEPVFADIADELLAFIRGAELIIHNAPFDVEFLNGEFAHAGRGDGVIEKHCEILDTLVMARHKHPGQRNSLDALCKRYAVDNEQRTLHGALLDAEILADVYLAMTGGQAGLFGEDQELPGYAADAKKGGAAKMRERIETPLIRANEEERAQHEKWLQLLEKETGGKVGALWKRAET
ncbi:MAG: DNA polymerase III subunit epsilon [Gammaproteobacteria bacterium]|nr:DNA polymerase III subunit epsilon [Gammaproteobacteria bacterium]